MNGIGEDTELLMHSGSVKNVRELIVGDCLMGVNGITRIICIKTLEEDMVRVETNRSEPIYVSKDHKMFISKRRGTGDEKFYTMSMDALMKGAWNTYMVRCKGVEFPKKELPIDPYVMGYFLGRGTYAHGYTCISINDNRVYEKLSSILAEEGLYFKKLNKATNTYYICSNDKKGVEAFNDKLKALGLYGYHTYQMFIPLVYKTSSEEQRMSLMGGLLDANSSLTGTKRSFTFFDNSISLVEDVRFVCLSLGMRATTPKRRYSYRQLSYAICITPKCQLPMVKTERHALLGGTTSLLNDSYSITPIGKGLCYEIITESGDYIDSQFYIHRL